MTGRLINVGCSVINLIALVLLMLSFSLSDSFLQVVPRRLSKSSQSTLPDHCLTLAWVKPSLRTS